MRRDQKTFCWGEILISENEHHNQKVMGGGRQQHLPVATTLYGVAQAIAN